MKLNKKVMNLMVALAVSLTSSCVVQAAEVKTPIYINSEVRAEGFIEKGVTYIPLRSVSEILGALVDWNEETKTVTLSKSYKVIEQRIGSDTAKVNNKVVPLGSPAIMRKGQTYVPLRFVSENLGAGVSWDKVKRAVQITAEGVVSKDQALKDKYAKLDTTVNKFEDFKVKPEHNYTGKKGVKSNTPRFDFMKLAYTTVEEILPFNNLGSNIYDIRMLGKGEDSYIEMDVSVKNTNYSPEVNILLKDGSMTIPLSVYDKSKTKKIFLADNGRYVTKFTYDYKHLKERHGFKQTDIDGLVFPKIIDGEMRGVVARFK